MSLIEECINNVYKHLGPDHLESAYSEALAIEFRHNHIEYHREYNIDLLYKDEKIGEKRLDFYIKDPFADEMVILELKAVKTLNESHKNQIKIYMESLGCMNGLLINFSGETAQILKMGETHEGEK